ncbi:MAG: D-alanyl-D-alanine carboxypeptidase/D-alanyl-D-alanine-endopeptidase [Bdellovibrionales bacterium]
MKSAKRWLALGGVAIALASGSAAADRAAEKATEKLSEKLAEKLDRLLKASRLHREEFAAKVVLAKSGAKETLWEIRSDQQMIPASLTKVITAGAVLRGLGPSRKLETKLWTAGETVADELNGDLILQGGGDPGFVSETMWFLVNEFTRTGIRKIKGNVIVDSARFDQIRTDPSRQSERVDRAFDAPVGAMSFNWNSVNIFVRPGAKAGAQAQVVLDPENDEVKLRGDVKTVGARGKTDIRVERKTGARGEDVIWINGQIPVDAKEFIAYKNISSPERWSGRVLLQFLRQRGITVSGEVKVGALPATAKQAARAESKPVADMVKDMMKFSNNFVAEMLVKNLAAEKKSTPASLGAGVELVRQYAISNGVPANRFTLVNPSGFSRENKITATDLNQVLLGLREEFGVFAEALASFPVAGVDGTLKSRMRGTAAEGRVRAKTGLLNGVAGLAGFAGRGDGSQLTFVFLFNGRTSRSEDARALFDQLAVQLVQ